MPNGKSTNDNQSQKTLYEPECRGHVVIDAPVTWKEGDVIAGLYVLRGILGEGKFGTVYHVYHQSWKIDLAGKSAKEDVLDDKGAVRRFLKEAQTWVELGTHTNIATSPGAVIRLGKALKKYSFEKRKSHGLFIWALQERPSNPSFS